MKVFWSIIAVLVLATAVLLARRAGTGPQPKATGVPAGNAQRSPVPSLGGAASPGAPVDDATPSEGARPEMPSRGVLPDAVTPAAPLSDNAQRSDAESVILDGSSEPVEASSGASDPTVAGEAGAVDVETDVDLAAGSDVRGDVGAGHVGGADSDGDGEVVGAVGAGPRMPGRVTAAMADEALGDLPDLDALLDESLRGLGEGVLEALALERAASPAAAAASAEVPLGDGSTGGVVSATPGVGSGSGLGFGEHAPESIVSPAAAQAAQEALRRQAELVLSEDQARPDAEPVAREPDGTLLLAGRFRVPGSGTVTDPYRVTWELLTSVRRTYDPAAGLTQLPAWIDALNGKHIELSGFVLFPVMAEASDELLLMYNQWDGCCIGVPPTPYDAIEVRLKTAPRNVPRWAVNYGKLRGRFDVDPYIVSNWLLGLYLLDAAELELAGV